GEGGCGGGGGWGGEGDGGVGGGRTGATHAGQRRARGGGRLRDPGRGDAPSHRRPGREVATDRLPPGGAIDREEESRRRSPAAGRPYQDAHRPHLPGVWRRAVGAR